MPNERYQDPIILTRTDVRRAYYYIQPYMPVLTVAGIKRKRQNVQLGFCDETSIVKARAAKQQIMAPLNAGRFVLQSQLPFQVIVQRFIDTHLPMLGQATAADYQNKITNHILPAFGEARMCDIRTDAIQAWLNGKTDLSWWSKQGLRNILSSIFSRAKEWNLWEGGNPCENVKVGRKTERFVKQIPQADSVNDFLDALPQTAICSAAAAQLIVLTAIASGARVSEILALQPRDIDPVGQTLTIARGWRRGAVVPTKSTASKRVRQIDKLAAELLAFVKGKRPDAFIFGRADRNGEPPDDRDLQQHVFRPAATAVGIYHPGFGMHVFRRLNISWRQEAGASPFEAQKAAGHAQPSTTWTYTITDDSREKQHVHTILERLNRSVVAPAENGTLAASAL